MEISFKSVVSALKIWDPPKRLVLVQLHFKTDVDILKHSGKIYE